MHRSPRLLCLLLARLLLACACISNVALAQTAATNAAGFQGVWYNIAGGGGYPNKYGGGLATYPQQIAPLAIYSPSQNKTYFTFSYDAPGGGTNVAHVLSYFDHATKQLARPKIWLTKGTPDAHDAPVLSIDGDGYIYMFSNTHGESDRSYIRRSANPYDIGSYVDLLGTGAADMNVFGPLPGGNPSVTVPRYSYASAWYIPNATDTDGNPDPNKLLLLHSRYSGGSQRDLFSTTSANGDTWTPRKGYSQIEQGQYQTTWIKPDGKTVGVIFDIHPTNVDDRTDLYYMETSDQARTFKTVNGTVLVNNNTGNAAGNPLGPTRTAAAAALVYDAPAGQRVYFKDVNYDAQGRPVIMYLTSSQSNSGPQNGQPDATPPDRQLWTARWDGAQWVRQAMKTAAGDLKTDNNYDHGSLFIEPDGKWRVIAPFLTGPANQKWATGGQMGMWTSTDQGANWTLIDQLTTESPAEYPNASAFSHTYARRVVDGQDDFYTFWAAGNAWNSSSVGLYFSDKVGNVYEMPFTTGTDMVAPILRHAALPEPTALALFGVGALRLMRRPRRANSSSRK